MYRPRLIPAVFALTTVTASLTQAEATTLTFIENNDLHAHLTAALDTVIKNVQVVYGSHGGLARVVTLVKQSLAQNPIRYE
ncbi:MAG: hypothetical protein HY018_02920 [Hydrogenophilales bacterium]|nr:hypothetical protein [Hydrogenophilales bacterium]